MGAQWTVKIGVHCHFPVAAIMPAPPPPAPPPTTPPKKHNLVSDICQHLVLYRLHKTESSHNMFFPVAAYLPSCTPAALLRLSRMEHFDEANPGCFKFDADKKENCWSKKQQKQQQQQQTSYKMILDLTLFCYDDDRPPYLCNSSGKGTKCWWKFRGLCPRSKLQVYQLVYCIQC